MEKQTIIKPEELGSDKTPKGLVKIEKIEPETIPVPTYEYGKSQNTIDAEIGLRNLSMRAPVIGNTTITATGSFSVLGVGFKPSIVIFNYSDGNGATGNGNMSSSAQYAQFIDIVGTAGSLSTSLAIWLQAGGVNFCRMAFASMDADGFTGNVTTAAGTAYVNYICFP